MRFPTDGAIQHSSRSLTSNVKEKHGEVAELLRPLLGKALDEIQLPEGGKPPPRRCLNPMAALLSSA